MMYSSSLVIRLKLMPIIFILLLHPLIGCQKIEEKKIEQNSPNYEKFIAETTSGIDEKKVLKDSYFGNFSKCKVVKIKDSVTLELWRPAYEYRLKNYPKELYDTLEKDNLLKLNIEYDEIWITENEDGLTKKEKIKWKRQNDIMKLYWKDGKVQAYTLAKLYTSNPLTDEILLPPEHEITKIYGRSYIINHPKDY